MASLLTKPFAKLRGKSAPTISVVRLEGALVNKPASAMGGRPLNLAAVAEPLQKAFANKKAKLVAISINSPGGSPVQSRFIAKRIRQLADEHEKKVIIFTEDVAASGGYWLACAGDEIIADPASIIGSIGVISAGFGFEGLIEKLGVERRVYTAGDNKMILDPFQPEKKADIAYLKKLHNDMHTQFIDHVKASRGDKLSDDKTIFSGRFWTGQKALELGLVDGLGDLHTNMAERFGKDVKLKLYGPRNDGLMKKIFSTRANPLHYAMQSAISMAEERALWSRFGL